MNIGSVVRLNNKVYDENRFKKNNILHYDLYFTDGSIPSMDIINKFLCNMHKLKNFLKKI